MFGVERTTPECPILPQRLQGRVARVLIATPEGKSQYLERVAQLYTNVWHVDAILKRVEELAAVIRPAIAESSTSSARYHDDQVNDLKERISQRDDSLRRQLARLTQQPKLVGNDTLRLSGWHRSTQQGSPEFRLEKSSEGQDVLYLAANGDTICSWRTKSMLEEGAYRFVGKIRTKNVTPSSREPNGGAGLRISGNGVAPELTSTQDWQTFSYPFRVSEGDGSVEVTFICELRASRGEAWFDMSSLRVVRLR
jgi:hypothetical protein